MFSLIQRGSPLNYFISVMMARPSASPISPHNPYPVRTPSKTPNPPTPQNPNTPKMTPQLFTPQVLTTDGADNFQTELLAQAQKFKDSGVRVLTIAAGAVVQEAAAGADESLSSLATLRDAATICDCKSCNNPRPASWRDGDPLWCPGSEYPCTSSTDSDKGRSCMQNSVCTGDCYRATNYNQLITTAVVKIVRENCEALISVRPGDICAARATKLVAEGVGFGGKAPAPGNLQFKIGDTFFPGVWKSDTLATVDLAAWSNQFGNAYFWDPVKDPYKTVTLRVQVSIDGGQTFLRENTTITNGYTITFRACSFINATGGPGHGNDHSGSYNSGSYPSGGGGGQQFVRTGDDYCSNGPNRYFCANDCNKFYYCNGQARGQNVNCPSGTRCMKLGPHRKYFDTDSQDNFDTADVTYACEKDADWGARSAKCWATPSAGKGECEVQNNKDRTCSGGGYCRSSLLDCKTGSGFEQTRPCKYDTPGGDCQCTTSILQPATDFDPTYSNNASIVSSEGRQCSIVEPGVRKQCNPPMDVLFVMDSSASIVTGGGVDGNREYAKARAFVKKFTSFFVLSSTETKVGYVSFSGDVTIVDANGDQKCANSLAKDWIVGDSPKNAIDIDSLHCVEAGAGDLDHVLLDDPSKVARSVDQKMQRGGTKMFLGMALARRILAQEKKAGRDQIVVCFP